MRILILIALAFIAPSAAIAEGTALYCDYVTYRGLPYMALEIPMSGRDKFADFARVKHINKVTVYEESLKTVQPSKGELYAFEVNQGKKKLNLQVFDKPVDKADTFKRLSSVLTSATNPKFVLIGECYIQ